MSPQSRAEADGRTKARRAAGEAKGSRKGRRSLADALGTVTALNGLTIRLGIQGTQATARKDTRSDDGTISQDPELSLVEVAHALEYGDPKRRVPEYAPYRVNASENGRRWLKALGKRVQTYARTGNASALDVGVRQVGLAMVSDQKATIVKIRTPPNSAYTIAKKGSDNPMIDTGQFLNSQRADVLIPGQPPFLVG